jgi:acetyl esterase/lipase
MNLAMVVLAGFLLMVAGCAANTASPEEAAPARVGIDYEEIPLWSDGAPGTEGRENLETDVDNVVRQTYQPSIRVFLPTPEKANGDALIICPGGGFNVLMMGYEGADVARRFQDGGVACFVLKYRIRLQDDKSFDHAKYSLLDAQRAVRTVRANAKRWNVRPDRIGIGGFSAGGHLSANAGTHFDAGDPSASDPIEKVSCRPDFLMLVYPACKGFAESVTDQTPPAFLVHGHNDTVVSSMHSVAFYQALLEADVSAEMHIFSDGPHGFGLGKQGGSPALWPNLFRRWIADSR